MKGLGLSLALLGSRASEVDQRWTWAFRPFGGPWKGIVGTQLLSPPPFLVSVPGGEQFCPTTLSLP